MQSAIIKKSNGSDSNVVPHFKAATSTVPFTEDVFSSTFCFNCIKFSGKSVSVTFPLNKKKKKKICEYF